MEFRGKRAHTYGRHLALAGAALGLALSPLAAPRPLTSVLPAIVLMAGAMALLAGARRPGNTADWIRVGVLAIVAAGIGLAAGSARLHAIDGGALRAQPDTAVALRGVLTAPPRQQSGGTALELRTPSGRALGMTRGPTRHLRVGQELAIRGRATEPAPWQADALRRRGIATVIEAWELAPTGASRGGLAGRLDAVRGSAEAALDRGMPAPQAALARGFVLGQDDRIDAATREDFRRSGLAHLLAVSGQNVVLLCLLAWPLLALSGLTLRTRLLALLALIAVYVPVTGAGASIQRAGVMGAAGLAAALAGTPRSRWYALLLAAAVTLALNPRVSGDIGWQLSFAAVIGILVWSRPMARLLSGGAPRGSPRHAIAEGAAVTVAATLATAPLMAHHFDSLPAAALPANLLALPAVAPAMWLGMLAGIAGQLPAIPTEPINWLNSLCLAYIAQIAHSLAKPDWALLNVHLANWVAVGLAYAGLAATMHAGLAWAGRRGDLRLRAGAAASPRGSGAGAGTPPQDPPRCARLLTVLRRHPGSRLLAVGTALFAGLWLAFATGERDAPNPGAFRVSVLDVGQGDAILLEPPSAEPVLVDTGPSGAGIGGMLRDRGVDSLAAMLVTHDQSDHAGGVGEVLGSVAVRRLGYGETSLDLAAHARAAGVDVMRLSEGAELRSGELRLTVLWPPAAVIGTGGDPNQRSLVLLAEWRHLSLLLTGDAEAEAVPLSPGPVDVLKVSHHGSADEGLDALLERSVPDLAVISVGENTYGHPTPETLAGLREHGVPVARTDEHGTLEIEADASGWRLTP